MKMLPICAFSILLSGVASAHSVLPTMGGAQVTRMDGAPMKHASIDFDGTDISVHVDESVATPLLRGLTEHEFDPAEPWAVLSGKAHNFQYGWVLGSTWAPPAGLSVYVEPLASTPGLEVYEGGRFMSEETIRMMTFEPIFAAGAPWVWSGVMTHNVYAVTNPTEASYEAIYRVYLADAVTGVEPTDALGAPVYGDDTVTFAWSATPVPEPVTLGLLLIAVATTLRTRR